MPTIELLTALARQLDTAAPPVVALRRHAAEMQFILDRLNGLFGRLARAEDLEAALADGALLKELASLKASVLAALTAGQEISDIYVANAEAIDTLIDTLTPPEEEGEDDDI